MPICFYATKAIICITVSNLDELAIKYIKDLPINIEPVLKQTITTHYPKKKWVLSHSLPLRRNNLVVSII